MHVGSSPSASFRGWGRDSDYSFCPPGALGGDSPVVPVPTATGAFWAWRGFAFSFEVLDRQHVSCSRREEKPGQPRTRFLGLECALAVCSPQTQPRHASPYELCPWPYSSVFLVLSSDLKF